MRARLPLALLLAAFVVGCGGDRDRNINRDSDRPRSTASEPDAGEKDRAVNEKDAKEKPREPKDAKPAEKGAKEKK